MKPEIASPAGVVGWPAGVSLHRPEPAPEIDPDPQPDDGNRGPTDPPTPQRAPEGDPPSGTPPEQCGGRNAARIA